MRESGCKSERQKARPLVRENVREKGRKGPGERSGRRGRDRQISRLVINEEQRSDGEGS
jgi:hypothetical protein